VRIEPLYIAAAEDKNGDVLIKAVNLTKEERDTQIFLQGITAGKHAVKASVLCGWQMQEENSFDEPEKIAPEEFDKEFEGENFMWKFPAESVTMLRIER